MAYKRRQPQRRRRRVARKRYSRRKIHGVSAVGYRGAYPSLTAQNFGVRRRGRLAGANARKRRVGFSSGPVRKRTRVADTGGYDQWRRYQYARKFGKMTVRKQLSSVVSYYDYIWRRLSPLRGLGALYFNHFRLIGPGTEDTIFTPIYLIDLTSARTTYGNALPVRQVVLNRGKADGGINTVGFEGVSGIAEDGTSLSPEWQMFGTNARTGSSGTASQLSGRAILSHSEIKIDFWGAKTRPCEFTATLCQIDEDCVPDPDAYPSNLSFQYLSDPKALAFWSALHDKLTFNPNVRRPDAGVGNVIRVKDRRQFMVDPIESTESDPDGHCKTVRLFYRHNRLVNFEWSAPSTVFNSENPLTFDPKINSKADCSPNPKARMYLMLTCASFGARVDSYEAQNQSTRGSMNLQVFNRWRDA